MYLQYLIVKNFWQQQIKKCISSDSDKIQRADFLRVYSLKSFFLLNFRTVVNLTVNFITQSDFLANFAMNDESFIILFVGLKYAVKLTNQI